MVNSTSPVRTHFNLMVVQGLLALATSIVSTFAIIFLLRAGFSIVQCGIFIMIEAITCAIAVTVFRGFTTTRKTMSMVIGVGLAAAYYLAFMVLKGYMMFFVAGVLNGLYMTFFWVSYNILIMKESPAALRGTAVGAYFLVAPLISIIGPVLGGFLIQSIGYLMLFSIGITILVINILFIVSFKIGDKRDQIGSFRSLSPDIFDKNRSISISGMSKNLGAALFLEGVQEGVFWFFLPIAGFKLAGGELSLGSMLSLFALVGAMITVALGFISDKLKNRRIFLSAGCIMAAIFCIALSFPGDISQFILKMSFTSFFLAIIGAFLFTMTADEMEQRMEASCVIREILLNTGRTLGAFLCLFAFLVTGSFGFGVFAAGIALILAAISVQYKKKKKR